MDSIWILLQLCIAIICNYAAYYCNCVLQQQQPNLHDLYFQQDGAPSHYFKGVQEHLDETFPLKWIEQRGPIDWPARSTDMTSMDFFVWRVLKDKVYSQKPRSVVDMKNYINNAFQEINTLRKLIRAKMFVEV